MNRTTALSALLTAALTLVPGSLLAQEADAEEALAQLRASATVESIEIVPATFRLTRGDTVTMEGFLKDADGNRVEGARWGIGSDDSVFDVDAIKDSIPDTYLVWGTGPGEAVMSVWILRPDSEDPDNPASTNWERQFDIEVVVDEWPAASIEIDAPEYAANVGATFPIRAAVLTDRGTKHATAELAWSSDNPDVLAISHDGVASFRAVGRATLRVRSEGLEQSRTVEVTASPVRSLAMMPTGASVRTGDVVQLEPAVLDASSNAVQGVHIAYLVNAIAGPSGGGTVYDDGAFVAEMPGTYQVVAMVDGQSASTIVSASARPEVKPITLLGRGPVPHVATSDLWVFEGVDGRDYAYTGTHAQGGGERMFVWDVTDPASPVLTDSVVVDARVVNDVKVTDDAMVAVITREGASDRKNGMVLLDLSDPAHPKILSEFNENLTGGVHNTWIIGDVVYAVNDGTNALNIVDISDPANPKDLGFWEVRPGEEDKNLHDVWADDQGLAYLSYWDDGLVILDVGNGIKGGTAREPKFVSSYAYQTRHGGTYGNTHTAYRWENYVFLGDEIFGCGECVNGPRGYIHVIDVSDLENPKEVAFYKVPEAGAHNIWVENGRLYIGYYQAGLRVVDVTGQLRGDLYAQGRQIGWYETTGAEDEAIVPNATNAWGPHVYKGNIFVADNNSGLWVVKPEWNPELVP